jgi:hypothetical protein
VILDVLYPGRRVVLDSGLSLAEVTSRLEKEVTPPATPWFRDTRTQLFEGTFANGRFEMARLVKGRDSFRPMLYGQLSATPGGTRIEIRMQLHLLVLAVGFIIASIAGMFASLAAYEVVPVIGRLPFVVQLLVIGLFALLFAALATRQARKVTRLLERLLDAREESCVISSSPHS